MAQVDREYGKEVALLRPLEKGGCPLAGSN